MADQYNEEFGERSAQGDRPVRELLSDLWADTQTLVRQELKLASSEVESKIEQTKADAMKAAMGAGAVYAGVLALVAALVLFVAKFVAPWVSAFIVGVAVLGLGYALMRSAKDVSARRLKPERSVSNLREDVRTLREATR
jgi:cytochrome c-type biogenesis protein CcmH/NrfG